MLNAKTGLVLAVAGLLGGHYASMHDQMLGKPASEMGPLSWAVAGLAFVVAAVGLWLLWRGDQGMPQH